MKVDRNHVHNTVHNNSNYKDLEKITTYVGCETQRKEGMNSLLLSLVNRVAFCDLPRVSSIAAKQISLFVLFIYITVIRNIHV